MDEAEVLVNLPERRGHGHIFPETLFEFQGAQTSLYDRSSQQRLHKPARRNNLAYSSAIRHSRLAGLAVGGHGVTGRAWLARLVKNTTGDVDPEPLRHVADAFLLGCRHHVAPFHGERD